MRSDIANTPITRRPDKLYDLSLSGATMKIFQISPNISSEHQHAKSYQNLEINTEEESQQQPHTLLKSLYRVSQNLINDMMKRFIKLK